MISDGWVDWANVERGPEAKTYSGVNAREGLVLHSMEGWLAGSFAELWKPSRSASWTFSLGLDGRLYQHYPVTASCWASGNNVANTRYNALELEGLYAMPINEAQIATLTRLVNELGYTRVELHEHREVWNMAEPNAGPTACPSERYAPFYAALEQGGEGMTDNDILAVFGSTEPDPAERLANAKYRYQQAIDTGHSPFDLAAQAQATLREHVANHAAGVSGPVADHTHEGGKVKR